MSGSENASVAVIGAGIVGLTTAAHIKQLLPHVKLTLIADKFNGDTTSDGAAGLFLPCENFQGPTPTSARDWIEYSYKFYDQLMKEDGNGIFKISGYNLSSSSDGNVWNKLMVGVSPQYRLATTEELLQFPGNWKQGTFMETRIIRCRTFLPWLTKRLTSKGLEIKKKTVNDFSELAGQYDVIVNCTGLQSRWLCNDDQVVPIRGQIIKVKSDYPHFVNVNRAYIIPNGDGLVSLGGTRDFDVWDDQVSKHDSKGIRERCAALVPEMASAPTAWEWVGLRPFRPSVRVEIEVKDNLKIVHNYGHGGYGVTTAPGTAKDAASFVKQLLENK